MPGLQVSVNINYFALCNRYDCFLGGWGLARYNTSVDVFAALLSINPEGVHCFNIDAVHFLDGFANFEFIRFQFDLKSILPLLIKARHLFSDDWSFQYAYVICRTTFEWLTELPR